MSMSRASEAFFRKLMGTGSERWNKRNRTSMESVNRLLLDRAVTRTFATLLGHDQRGNPVTLSGEDRRTHLEMFGGTGQGKSKVLELLIRDNVDNGYACCLIDPTENGATGKAVL